MTWKTNLPECFKPANVSIYPPPVDWNVACALTNLRAGVPLTETQKALLARRRAELSEGVQTDLEEFLT